MNEVSSRSHCILTVYVEGLNKLTNLRSFGKLHLVPPSSALQYHSALRLRLAARADASSAAHCIRLGMS
jgi:hypothetical protein